MFDRKDLSPLAQNILTVAVRPCSHDPTRPRPAAAPPPLLLPLSQPAPAVVVAGAFPKTSHSLSVTSSPLKPPFALCPAPGALILMLRPSTPPGKWGRSRTSAEGPRTH